MRAPMSWRRGRRGARREASGWEAGDSTDPPLLQNPGANDPGKKNDTNKSCKTTPGCVGYSLNNNLCFLKSNIDYFQYQKDSSSEQVCYRPSSYVNMSISGDNVLGIEENMF